MGSIAIFDKRNVDYESKCIAAWMLQTLVNLRLWNPSGHDYIVDLMETYEEENVINRMEWHVEMQRKETT